MYAKWWWWYKDLTCLSINDYGLDLSQVRHDVLAILLDFHCLLRELMLDLLRLHLLLLFSLLLILEHLFQLGVGGFVDGSFSLIEAFCRSNSNAGDLRVKFNCQIIDTSTCFAMALSSDFFAVAEPDSGRSQLVQS